MGLFSEEEKAPLVPFGGATTLEDIYKFIRGQLGKSDANALTNQLAVVVLEHSIREGASDVHFEPQGDVIQVRFRIDGELKDRLTFSRKELPVTSHLRVEAGFSPQAASAYSPEDGAFAVTIDKRPVRFRASSFPTIHGDKLVIRLLDMGANTLNLDALGFAPEDLEQLKAAISSPSGIFFVCGITGGGKTTTLCSVLNYLNRPDINIMTLEDPVEYQLARTTQSSVNPKAGFSFADGLRSILRQDPNIIMVGEVRDLETAEIAMRAALTGHLIFSTIHTISTTGVITRLIDMGIPPFLITDALIGALAQRLVRRVCADCAEPVEADSEAADKIVRSLPPEDTKVVLKLIMAPGAKFMKGKGCEKCKGTGYKGRTGIFEMLTLNKTLRDLIAAKTSLAELRRAAVTSGMRTLLMDGVYKAWSGLTTLDEIRRVTTEL
jgi:type IV pilus assembly protein PilB